MSEQCPLPAHSPNTLSSLASATVLFLTPNCLCSVYCRYDQDMTPNSCPASSVFSQCQPGPRNNSLALPWTFLGAEMGPQSSELFLLIKQDFQLTVTKTPLENFVSLLPHVQSFYFNQLIDPWGTLSKRLFWAVHG